MCSSGAFFGRLRDALAVGPVALMTVVHAQGSTPRTTGARQFLASSGATCGSVGGGVTESRVLQLARETLADGKPRSFRADLGGSMVDMRDGVCGGLMTVWIVRLEGAAVHATVRSLAEALHAGQRVALVTYRDFLPGLAIKDSAAVEGVPEECFEETIEPVPALLIVGAGHIGRALAELAVRLEFAVTVQDDRREWLDVAAFNSECVLEPVLNDAIDAIRNWQGARYAALVTRGVAQDLEALSALRSGAPWRYVGVLGSKRRVERVLAGQAEWENGILHAPTGIEIGAETPMEIAVSIAAEMIQVMRSARS